jgi:hypothetical protein
MTGTEEFIIMGLVLVIFVRVLVLGEVNGLLVDFK